MLVDKSKRQDIDIYDHNFILLFDIDDQEYIRNTFVNDIRAMSNLITRFNFKRARLRKDMKLLYEAYKQPNLNHQIEIGIRMSIVKEQIQTIDRSLYNYRFEQMELIKKFYRLCHLRYNDQTVDREHQKFAPIDQQYKYDVYVSGGVDSIGGQITNTSSVIWEYVHIGRSPRKATIGDQQLDDPIGGFPIDDGGSFSSIGDQIRLFCVLPDQIPDNDIYEFSVNELPEGGKILSRTTFKKPIKHRLGKTFPTITNVTYLIPHLEDED